MCLLPLILLLLNCCSAEKTTKLFNQLENSTPLKRSKKKDIHDLPFAKVGFTNSDFYVEILNNMNNLGNIKFL